MPERDYTRLDRIRGKRPSKRGTVAVALSSEQATRAADWLIANYKPGKPPPLSRVDWAKQQLAIAGACAGILKNAARRKRRASAFDLRIPRDLAQWLGAFTRPEGWWIFGNVRVPAQWSHVPAQWSPKPIRRIAALFLKAANRRKGRTNPTLRELEARLHRLEANPDADLRWQRRLKARIRDLRLARAETLKAGHD